MNRKARRRTAIGMAASGALAAGLIGLAPAAFADDLVDVSGGGSGDVSSPIGSGGGSVEGGGNANTSGGGGSAEGSGGFESPIGSGGGSGGGGADISLPGF